MFCLFWKSIRDRVEAKGPTPLARDKMSIVSKANGVAYVFGGFGPMVGEDEDGWGDGQTFHWLGDVIYIFIVIKYIFFFFSFIENDNKNIELNLKLHTFDSASKEWKKLPSIDAPKLCAVGGLVCELGMCILIGLKNIYIYIFFIFLFINYNRK